MRNGKRESGGSAQSRDDPIEIIDRVYIDLEEVERVVARIVSSDCECVKGGWIYMVMDSLERVYDRLAELRAEVKRRCG